VENMIEVTDVGKKFGKKHALNQISFQVKKGEIFGLLGPSGAGKTTTIKLLTGELSKTSGDISVLGFTPDRFQTETFKSQIGILSDNSALYERLTIFDNLKLFAKLYDVPLHEIDSILEQVNLLEEKKTTVSKLSKGMKQRILLAKALIHKPKLVFLDEPTSALDPANVAHIHRGLQTLNENGTTIFLNTHDMEEANSLCDRVAFLHQGVIQELDEPDALRYKHSTHAFHIETVGGKKFSLDPKPENADEIASLIKQKEIKTMHTDNPTLGQIFLKITGKELV